MRKFFFLTMMLFSICVSAQVEKIIPPAPSPPRLVNDYAALLTPEQADHLETKLVAYDDSTSNQVAIVIVPDLKGYTANEYATALGRKWGVGGSQFSNGVVILISTGGGAGNRDAYIAVGYGLEGAIPDITAKAIVENEIIPHFKEGHYYRGLNSAVDAIIKAAAGEYTASFKIKKEWIGRMIGIIIFLTIIIIAIASKKSGGGGMISRRGYGEFGTGWLIGSLMSGGGKGGGGWSGGGGGFGGFGGGSFGGGGAGGKW